MRFDDVLDKFWEVFKRQTDPEYWITETNEKIKVDDSRQCVVGMRYFVEELMREHEKSLNLGITSNNYTQMDSILSEVLISNDTLSDGSLKIDPYDDMEIQVIDLIRLCYQIMFNQHRHPDDNKWVLQDGHKLDVTSKHTCITVLSHVEQTLRTIYAGECFEIIHFISLRKWISQYKCLNQYDNRDLNEALDIFLNEVRLMIS